MTALSSHLTVVQVLYIKLCTILWVSLSDLVPSLYWCCCFRVFCWMDVLLNTFESYQLKCLFSPHVNHRVSVFTCKMITFSFKTFLAFMIHVNPFTCSLLDAVSFVMSFVMSMHIEMYCSKALLNSSLWYIVGKLLVGCWFFVGRQSANSWPTASRQTEVEALVHNYYRLMCNVMV